MRLSLPSRVSFSLLIVVSLVTVAVALRANDAGTGGDASDVAWAPTHVALGTSYLGNLTDSDVDRYDFPAAATGDATCASFVLDSASGVSQRLGLDAHSVSVGSVVASSVSGGIAQPSMSGATLAVSPLYRWSNERAYGFQLSTTSLQGVGSDSNSAGDAGGSLDHATVADGVGCIGGHLATVDASSPLDIADDYEIGHLPANSTVVLSVVASTSTLAIQLLDSSGHAVAPSVATGQLVSITVPSTDTYYLTASRTSVGVDTIGYLVGVIVGPPSDPGNPCRPYCLGIS